MPGAVVRGRLSALLSTTRFTGVVLLVVFVGDPGVLGDVDGNVATLRGEGIPPERRGLDPVSLLALGLPGVAEPEKLKDEDLVVEAKVGLVDREAKRGVLKEDPLNGSGFEAAVVLDVDLANNDTLGVGGDFALDAAAAADLGAEGDAAVLS